MAVPSSQLLAPERLKLQLKMSIRIVLQCSHVCQTGAADAQGRDKDWEGYSFPMAACGLAACLSPHLSSPGRLLPSVFSFHC